MLWTVVEVRLQLGRWNMEGVERHVGGYRGLYRAPPKKVDGLMHDGSDCLVMELGRARDVLCEGSNQQINKVGHGIKDRSTARREACWHTVQAKLVGQIIFIDFSSLLTEIDNYLIKVTSWCLHMAEVIAEADILDC